MGKFFRTLSMVVPAIIFLGSASTGIAAGSNASFIEGRVMSVSQAPGSADVDQIKLLNGSQSGQIVSATVSGLTNTIDVAPPAYKPGNIVIVQRSSGESQVSYTVIDHYRLPSAGWIFIVIMILAVIFAGWRGLGSLLGLGLSVTVLAAYVIPQALRTGNPYPPTIIGVVLVAGIGMYVAHGFSRRTSLALLASYLTLALAIGLSIGIVALLHLNGVSSENIYYLAQLKPGLDIPGLLACGMIISMIGILDDITVGQATAVEELQAANHALTPLELYKRAGKIGREHIASMINTLVLAFVGTSILFISYIVTVSQYPLWITLNSSPVMEEVARSLVGSITLILAVPLSSLLASRFLRRRHPHPAAVAVHAPQKGETKPLR
jgi:uncharacterized membrane protein